MASFCLSVYFPFRYHTFLVGPETQYSDLFKAVFDHFNIGSNNDNIFLLQIFDTRYKLYLEFDDGYINQLRQQLPRTSIENILARIVCRQQLYLLSRQSFFSIGNEETFPVRQGLGSSTTMFSLPSYQIVWLDEYFARPTNFRSMKRYLFTTTLIGGPIYDTLWHDTDIDNLIIDDYAIDFDWPAFNGHLKMFMDVDQCRHYISSGQHDLILLITSDTNGKKILSCSCEKVLKTYILRDVWDDWQWGLDYIESLQMFDDDWCMLTRIVRDLARYFVDTASQVPPNEAFIYLKEAKKLYIQADREPLYRSRGYTSTILHYIDHQLNHLEAIVKVENQGYEED